MSKKNIVLIVICVIGLFFVVKRAFKLFSPRSSVVQREHIRIDYAVQWLKKKNVTYAAFYGPLTGTFATQLSNASIELDRDAVFSEERIDENSSKEEDDKERTYNFFKKVNSKKLKCVVLESDINSEKIHEELKEFFSNGGVLYARGFDMKMLKYPEMYQLMQTYLEKGQICIEVRKGSSDVRRGMSEEKIVAAETYFINETNLSPFKVIYEDFLKEGSE